MVGRDQRAAVRRIHGAQYVDRGRDVGPRPGLHRRSVPAGKPVDYGLLELRERIRRSGEVLVVEVEVVGGQPTDVRVID